MTSLTDEDLDRLEALAKAALKAAPGEWARDCQDSEGAYGSGPDARHGFRVPVLYVGGKQVLTADGSEIALICEECDEDGGSAWDDTSMDVVDYIAAANPAAILALLSAARSQGPGEGLDEPTRWLLRYVDASGGKVSASEYRGNPIDLWCDDRGQETDTLNVAIEDGLLSCSHNSDTDESWVWITDAGRRALPAPPASQIKEG